MFLLNQHEKDRVLDFARKTFIPHLIEPVNSFEELPLFNKARALFFYNLPETNELRSFASTGTSGNPKKINWSPREDIWYIGDKREVILHFLKGCEKIFISLGVGHGSGTSPRVFKNSSIEVCRVEVDSINNNILKLENFSPDVLYCSPSILVSLIKHGNAKKRPLEGIKKIVLNGEVVYQGLIDYFCNYLNITKDDILDTYGSTEAGTIACSCSSCGKYHFMPGIIPESVPASHIEDSLPADEDILLLNSLKRESFPVIRFVTYDLVRGLSRTVCNGKEYYSFERLLGRCDDVLNFGELLPAADIIGLIKRYYPEKEYFIFNYRNHVDILIEGKENPEFVKDVYGLYPVIGDMIVSGMLEKFNTHFFESLDPVREFYSLPGVSSVVPLKEGNRIIKKNFLEYRFS
ncbi:MAG: hypothetical protein GY754_14080 [bacterium]|nr:hypothetical protein [bacterium]